MTHKDSVGIASVAFGPKGGNAVASGGVRGTVAVWDLATRKARLTLDDGNRKPVHALAFDPNGKFLASVSGDEKVKVWSLTDGTLLATLSAREVAGNYLPRALAISPDGALLAAGGMSPKYKAVVQVWTTAKFEKAYSLDGHEHEITALSFGPNGQFLAAADRKAVINVWNLEAKGVSRSIDTRHSNVITSVQFREDWTLLSAADNKLRTWDPQSGKEIQQLYDGGNFNKGTVEAAAWGPDGKRVAFSQIDGFAGVVRLLDPATAKVSDTKFVFEKHVTRLAWDPAGGRLAVGSLDGNVYIRDVK